MQGVVPRKVAAYRRATGRGEVMDACTCSNGKCHQHEARYSLTGTGMAYLAQADKKEKGIKTVLYCAVCLLMINAHVCRPSPYRPSRAPAIGVNDGRSTAPGIEKMLPLAGHHKGCQTGAHHLRQTPPVDGRLACCLFLLPLPPLFKTR